MAYLVKMLGEDKKSSAKVGAILWSDQMKLETLFPARMWDQLCGHNNN